MTQKSTFVRIISIFLRCLNALSPSLASELSCGLFLTPTKRKVSSRELRVLGQSERFELQCGSNTLVGHAWGRGEPVLLVHGWGGYSGQFADLVFALVTRGYRVVAVDFPAHGTSPGRQSNVFEFRSALLQLARQHKEFRAVVAHSLGAMAAAMALREGLRTERAVFVAPMTSYEFAMSTFSSQLALSEQLEESTIARFERTFGVDRQTLELSRHVCDMTTPLLVIHDGDDRVVPARLGRDLAAAWPRAGYVETRGLGHGRILSAPDVIGEIVRFLELPAKPAIKPPQSYIGDSIEPAKGAGTSLSV